MSQPLTQQSPPQVVLVRPWTDAHAGGGCCGGDPRGGVCLEDRVGVPEGHDEEVHRVAEAYRRLRSELPGVDVQVVAANNTAFLLPSVWRAVRRRRGAVAALREVNRATTAGSVLVDGERVGDVLALGPEGVVREVRSRLLE